MKRLIHWFRRDLRLADNTGLLRAAAESGGHVVPVFVLDPALLHGRDIAPARVAFLMGCLRVLDDALRQRGSKLVVRHGEPGAVLTALAAETGATAVTYNRDYTPLARRRDARVTEALESAGVSVTGYADAYIHEPGSVVHSAPYTVFTPFKRAWLLRPQPQVDPTALPPLITPPDVVGESIPELALPDGAPAPGERAAFAQLQAFSRSGGLDGYAARRDLLAEEGTSRLSAHLRFGTLSPRQAARAARAGGDAAGPQTFLSELIWREFYAHVLWHFPHADRANFNRAWDAVAWGSGDEGQDDRRLEAWRAGQTGYPVVDAAMRQLAVTGWMHNRARMIAASFLTRDLFLDWRLGEAHFMRALIDGDPASNNGGWQWSAGSGTDAQPWFRIFNPTLQGQRFDPAGDFVRRWVPELSRVPTSKIHTPWEMTPAEQAVAGCVIGRDYPSPIVDHAVQREDALQRYAVLKSRPARS